MERCGEALRDYAQKSSNPSGLTPQKVVMSSLIKKKKILAMKLAKDQPMNPGLTHDLVGGFNQPPKKNVNLGHHCKHRLSIDLKKVKPPVKKNTVPGICWVISSNSTIRASTPCRALPAKTPQKKGPKMKGELPAN